MNNPLKPIIRLFAISIVLLSACAIAGAQTSGNQPHTAKKRTVNTAAQTVTGSGTGGSLTRWTSGGNSVIGDSVVFEDKSGKVGVGTKRPTSALTVVGVVETTNGVRFPDGTVQTTAATSGLTAVSHDATLTGSGTAASPLSVAAPASASQPFTAVIGTSGSDTFTIPAGKRLVVEFVSGSGFVTTGEKFLTLDLSYSALVNGIPQTVQHHFVPLFVGTNNGGNPIDVYSFSQPAHFDAEPGTVQLLALRTGGTGNFSLTISGHLE